MNPLLYPAQLSVHLVVILAKFYCYTVHDYIRSD